MIGTLISLIQMLAQIEDPGKLGPGMAAALITTFYGAIMANLFFNPMAGKLAIRSEEEMLIKELMLEGVTSIQAGMNPQVLEEKLRSYLAPDQKNDKPTIVIGRSKQDGLNVHV
jgi:chemotaxis protein MotA